MGRMGWIWAYVTLGIVAVMALLFMAGPAPAQDRGAWFKSLKSPTTGVSCCDVSDCKRTDAEWRGGQWHAMVWGEEKPIPNELIVRDVPTLDGEAYVCAFPWGEKRVLCFVPPSPGS